MENLGNSYSKIIDPNAYNRIITEEHLYILNAFKYIESSIREIANASTEDLNVVDIGCGPATLTAFLDNINKVNLFGIDADKQFIDYATKTLPNAQFINASIVDFKFNFFINIFVSSGMHHHISKGVETESYLKNIYNHLPKNGYYFISDEFIPDYNSEEERDLRLIVWYSHIIAHALKQNFSYLAQEEAKTLLDDINEGKIVKTRKCQSQIDLVLSNAEKIDLFASAGEIQNAQELAKILLNDLYSKIESLEEEQDNAMILSRKDYKISDRIFKLEIEKAGFKIAKKQAFGPIEDIGAMVVYVLQKI